LEPERTRLLSIQALTDGIATDARAWADRVAESAVTSGLHGGCAPRAVSALAVPFPGGRLVDASATAELIELIDAVAATARSSLGTLEEADVVAHALMVDIVEGLERYSWMLRAQSR
jgi:DNA-binding ferritin-like protein